MNTSKSCPDETDGLDLAPELTDGDILDAMWHVPGYLLTSAPRTSRH